MTYAEQLASLFEMSRDHLSVEPYLLSEMPTGHREMLKHMGKVGEAERMNCCLYHRREALMSIWCGGVSIGIRLYQMYGEPDDLRELLTNVEPPVEESQHD